MSFMDKIQKLEEEKKKLIEKREQEILKVIRETKALDVDNKLLATLLLFLKNSENKNHSFIKELEASLKNKSKTPSRTSKELKPA